MSHADDSPGAVILGGGFVGLEAARSLDRHGVRVCVVGSANSVSRFSRSVSRFVRWPADLREEGLPDFLVALAGQCRLRGWVLFPTYDEHLRILAEHRLLLAEHFVLTTPPWETVRQLYDKRLTCTLARNAGVPIPQVYAPGSADPPAVPDVDFPVVLKPAVSSRFVGATNRKAYRADNRQELLSRYAAMVQVIPPAEVIVQEFIPEPSRNLFSFAGYFRHGEPVAGLGAKRTRQFPRDFGRSSSLVEAVEVPELRELAGRLLRAIDYTGLAEVEFMWNGKRARFELLEVNARLWAWHGLARAAGIDLPYVAFAEALGRRPAVGPVHPGVKWVRLLTDVRAAAQEIHAGRLGVARYLGSLRGAKAFSVFSLADPLPFVAEPLLLLFDLLRKRMARRRRRVPSAGSPPAGKPAAPGSGGPAGI